MADKRTLSPDQRRRLTGSMAGWIATGLGSGLAPVAQGTFGSAAAILPWLLLRQLPWPAYLAVLLAVFALGVWACQVAGRMLGVDDHRSLVIDEFVGQWIALLPALTAFHPGQGATGWSVLVGFALFRLFDVWKPWPIGWFDRHLKGGAGVMIDDVWAGVFAAVALGALMLFMHQG